MRTAVTAADIVIVNIGMTILRGSHSARGDGALGRVVPGWTGI
jgi:hypothetical protein